MSKHRRFPPYRFFSPDAFVTAALAAYYGASAECSRFNSESPGSVGRGDFAFCVMQALGERIIGMAAHRGVPLSVSIEVGGDDPDGTHAGGGWSGASAVAARRAPTTEAGPART
jgi:hypothetical protein